MSIASEDAQELIDPQHLDRLALCVDDEAAAAELLELRFAALGALVIGHGARYLPMATEELETAFDDFCTRSARRRRVLSKVAEFLGCQPDATLLEVAERCAPPFSERLSELRDRLCEIRSRIEQLAGENSDLLGRRLALADEALADAAGDEASPTYGRPSPSRPRLIRGVL